MELSDAEVLAALEGALERNVGGGRVYDYLHAIGAEKVKSEVILTRNPRDFEGLGGTARVEWP